MRALVGYDRITELAVFFLAIGGVPRGEGCVELDFDNAEEVAGQKLDPSLDYFLEEYSS